MSLPSIQGQAQPSIQGQTQAQTNSKLPKTEKLNATTQDGSDSQLEVSNARANNQKAKMDHDQKVMMDTVARIVDIR